MGDRLAADPGIGIGDASQHVVVVLEHVGVDDPDAHPEVGGVLGEDAVVVDLVPRDMQGDARGHAGETVHRGRVRDLLERVPGDTFLGEDLEAGSGVPECPGRQLDGLRLKHLDGSLSAGAGECLP